MIFELLDALMSAVDEAVNEETKTDKPKRPTAEEARQPHPHTLCPSRNGGKVPKLSELITDVIVRDDYVIVYWADKTIMHVKKHKTETFDIEKAIAMATLKYLFGNKYYSDFVEVVAKAKTVDNAANTTTTTTTTTVNNVDSVKKETDNVNTVEKSKSAKNKSTSKTKSTKSSKSAKTAKATKATSASTKTKKSSETAGARSAKTTKSKK